MQRRAVANPGLKAAGRVARVFFICALFLLLCAPNLASLCPAAIASQSDELPADHVRTLSSLRRIDDHPLYVMEFYGSYDWTSGGSEMTNVTQRDVPPWACSLFAAMGNGEDPLFGRNFDWPHHPALILFTDAPDCYASVSIVDLWAFVDPRIAGVLETLSIEDRQPLLHAPSWPFDGMNECGVAIAMAAVSSSTTPFDSSRPTYGPLKIIREILDHAATVEEAIAIFGSANVLMTGGVSLHYLVADAHGQAALIEFWERELHVLRNVDPWLCATNYRLCLFPEEERPGVCWRYDIASRVLSDVNGILSPGGAMALLEDIQQETSDHQGDTQWSVVYGLRSGEIRVAMGRRYDQVYAFQLTMTNSEAEVP